MKDVGLGVAEYFQIISSQGLLQRQTVSATGFKEQGLLNYLFLIGIRGSDDSEKSD